MMMAMSVICHIVIMLVRVNDFVRVCAAVVSMRQEMMVLVDVAVDDGIGHGENCSCYHQDEGNHIDACQVLLQEYEGQESTDERRKGIIGTGAGGTD